MMFFILITDNTPINRQTCGDIFSDNGSGETSMCEQELFDLAIRLSPTGLEPATNIGVSATMKESMRIEMEAFLDTLLLSRYYVAANMETEINFEGELVADNKAESLVGLPPWDVQPFTFQDALNDLFISDGLQVIE